MTTTPRKMILSYGLGVDSTSILLEWLANPASRDFELKDLIVLYAQLGDEFEGTTALVETHILPRLKAAGVRFVEVGRVSASAKDGIVVLQDSREPVQLHPHDSFKLSDELSAAGTIPASGGLHLCSIHAKAEVLDRWLAENFADETYAHAMGFNADETNRAARDIEARGKRGALIPDYRIAFGFNADEQKRADQGLKARDQKGQSAPEFPLIGWGWNYQDCIDQIESHTGVIWKKSSCTFCPFSGGRAPVLKRYQEEPQAAARAMLLEAVALALNPRMALYKTKTLREMLTKDGNVAALAAFDALANAEEWAVYRVRRIYSGPGKAVRDVQILARGTREECETQAIGTVIERDANPTIELVEKAGGKTSKRYSTTVIEELISAAPGRAHAKSGSKNFDEKWAAAIEILEIASTIKRAA